mgnify:FL=1
MSRGTPANFSWEKVKEDKYRQNFLAHSLFAPVGRWQKGKDLTWYAKSKNRGESREDEIRRLKEEEERLMAEELGFVPKRKRAPSIDEIDRTELRNVLKKNQVHRDEVPSERVSGLGAAPSKRHNHVKRERESSEDDSSSEEESPSRDNDRSIQRSADLNTDRHDEDTLERPTRNRRHDSDDDEEEDDERRERKRKKKKKKKKKKIWKKGKKICEKK